MARQTRQPESLWRIGEIKAIGHDNDTNLPGKATRKGVTPQRNWLPQLINRGKEKRSKRRKKIGPSGVSCGKRAKPAGLLNKKKETGNASIHLYSGMKKGKQHVYRQRGGRVLTKGGSSGRSNDML